MKSRHAAALALAWILFIPQPKTSPKDCSDCAVTMEKSATMTKGFPTQEACLRAAAKWKADFIRGAKKNNLDVSWPPDPIQCFRDGSTN